MNILEYVIDGRVVITEVTQTSVDYRIGDSIALESVDYLVEEVDVRTHYNYQVSLYIIYLKVDNLNNII